MLRAAMGSSYESCREGVEAPALPRDITLLLSEIEKEPIPDRLLTLAIELQQALALHSRDEKPVVPVEVAAGA